MTPREIRKMYGAAKVAPKEYVAIDGMLVWRNVDHYSVQVYMLELERDYRNELVARHSMITVKGEMKKQGLTRPTTTEVEAWQRLIGPTP